MEDHEEFDDYKGNTIKFNSNANEKEKDKRKVTFNDAETYEIKYKVTISQNINEEMGEWEQSQIQKGIAQKKFNDTDLDDIEHVHDDVFTNASIEDLTSK